MKKLLFSLVLVLSTFAGYAQTLKPNIITQDATADEVRKQLELCLDYFQNIATELNELEERAGMLMQEERREQIYAELDMLKFQLSIIHEKILNFYNSGDYTGFSYEGIRAELDQAASQLNNLFEQVEIARKEASVRLEDWLSNGSAILNRIHEIEYRLDRLVLDDEKKQTIHYCLEKVKEICDRFFAVLVKAKDSEDFSDIYDKEIEQELTSMEDMLADTEACLHEILITEIENCLKRCHDYMERVDRLNEKINVALNNGNQAMNVLAEAAKELEYLLLEIEENCTEVIVNGINSDSRLDYILNSLDKAENQIDYLEARYEEMANGDAAVIEKYIAELQALHVEIDELYKAMDISAQSGNIHIKQLFPEIASLIDAVDTLCAELVYIQGCGEYDKFNEAEVNDLLTGFKARFAILCAMANDSYIAFDKYLNLKEQIELVELILSQASSFDLSSTEVRDIVGEVVSEFDASIGIYTEKVENLFLSQALSSDEYNVCLSEINELKDIVVRLIKCIDYISYFNCTFDEYMMYIEKYCPDVKDRFIQEMDDCMAKFTSHLSHLREVVENSEASNNFISYIKGLVEEPYQIYQAAVKAQNEYTGVNGVVVSDGADVEYYTLGGRKVANPAAGTIVLRVSAGGNVQKVLVK